MIFPIVFALSAGLLAGFAMVRNQSVQKTQQEKLAARLAANVSTSVFDSIVLTDDVDYEVAASGGTMTTLSAGTGQPSLLTLEPLIVTEEQTQLLIERLAHIETLSKQRKQLVLNQYGQPTWLVPMQAMAVEVIHEFLVFCETQPVSCPEYTDQSLWMKKLLEAYAFHKQNTLWACASIVDASEGDLVLQIPAAHNEFELTPMISQDFIEIPRFGDSATLFLDEDLTFDLSHIDNPVIADINERLQRRLDINGPADIELVVGGLQSQDVFVVQTAQGRLAWAYHAKKYPTLHLFNDAALGNEHGLMLSAWYLNQENVLDVVGIVEQELCLDSIHIHKGHL